MALRGYTVSIEWWSGEWTVNVDYKRRGDRRRQVHVLVLRDGIRMAREWVEKEGR